MQVIGRAGLLVAPLGGLVVDHLSPGTVELSKVDSGRWDGGLFIVTVQYSSAVKYLPRYPIRYGCREEGGNVDDMQYAECNYLDAILARERVDINVDCLVVLSHRIVSVVSHWIHGIGSCVQWWWAKPRLPSFW
jgi:hypothetical protein